MHSYTTFNLHSITIYKNISCTDEYGHKSTNFCYFIIRKSIKSPSIAYRTYNLYGNCSITCYQSASSINSHISVVVPLHKFLDRLHTNIYPKCMHLLMEIFHLNVYLCMKILWCAKNLFMLKTGVVIVFKLIKMLKISTYRKRAKKDMQHNCN